MIEHILSLVKGFNARDTNTAFWSAFLDKEVTWVNDEHGHIAAIVNPDMVEYAIRHGWGR